MMARFLIVLVKGYRLLLSPWLGGTCRFEPTCSRYAIEALERFGAGRGTLLAAWRLLRCQPWCRGGLDPVPDRLGPPFSGMFTRFTHQRPAGDAAAPHSETYARVPHE